MGHRTPPGPLIHAGPVRAAVLRAAPEARPGVTHPATTAASLPLPRIKAGHRPDEDGMADDDIDLGPPKEWGPDCILVVDTLTFLSDAAWNFYDSINANPDKRSTFFEAQKGILAVLAQLNSDNFETNVILNSHIVFVDTDEGKTKGFPSTVGKAIASKVNAYFNTVALFETIQGGERRIKTVPTRTIDLKNPRPFDMAKEYPIETGLASIFEVLRAKPAETKITHLKRKA